MMAKLARALARRGVALVVVLVVLAVGTVCALLATRLEQEDDLLAFLPKNDPDVVHFRRLTRRFGGLDVALVGIASDDVFAAPFVERLIKLTRELEDVRGLDHVLSLSNLVDFVPDPKKGGIVTGPLVRAAPKNAAEKRALRRKVLSRDHAVGNLVAR
ncbi:MAG: hypothetical protein KC503_42980, partial [Myxococcales bacterium]|nr:hypothetical protein [Myxococcales bacterium]